MLKDLLEDIEFGGSPDPVEFANTWMAATDAQWYTIIGDPAVRLPVVDAGKAQSRPMLVSTTADLVPPPAGDLPPEPGPDAGSVPGDQPAQPAKEKLVSESTPVDPRFAHPYSPAPAPTEELAALKAKHPEMYDAYVAHVKEGYAKNTRIFDDVRRAFLRSHYSTVLMYWILFAIGAGTVITGVVLAVQGSPVTGALFLGVGVAAFVTYFVGRSVVSVEENLIYITWLGVIYNSYWTHLAWAMQRKTAQAELDKATVDALKQLEKLVDRHAKSVRGRPKLRKGDEATVAQAEPAAQTGSAGDTQTLDDAGS
jgi:hypothetical protein